MRSLIKTIVLSASHIVYKLSKKKDVEVVVLMYHSVEGSTWKYGVDPEAFKRQMEYLKQTTQVVPFSDVVDFIYGRKVLKGRVAALTFDDGYRDTYEVVFPILKEYSIPATLFLTTDLSPRKKLGNLERPTWDQLKEMQESGLVSLEVHGRSHKNFTEIESEKEFEEEILGCRDDIKEHSGYVPRFVAYPSGNHSKEAIRYIETHGFAAACSINEGLVTKGDNPYLIKRVQVDRTTSFSQFRMRLTGGVEINRGLVDSLRR